MFNGLLDCKIIIGLECLIGKWCSVSFSDFFLMRNSPNNLMFLLNYISFRFAKIPNSVMGSPRSDLHLVLIPGLHFLSAACWDLLILALHIRDDVLHVQHPSVVHLHYNRRVLHFSLQLLQFLHTHTHTHTHRERERDKIHLRTFRCFIHVSELELPVHRSTWKSSSHQGFLICSPPLHFYTSTSCPHPVRAFTLVSLADAFCKQTTNVRQCCIDHQGCGLSSQGLGRSWSSYTVEEDGSRNIFW